MTMPPRFFDDDMDKWKKKFTKSLKEREQQKQLMKRTQYISCLNRNINVRDENSQAMQKSKSVKGSVSRAPEEKSTSLFN